MEVQLLVQEIWGSWEEAQVRERRLGEREQQLLQLEQHCKQQQEQARLAQQQAEARVGASEARERDTRAAPVFEQQLLMARATEVQREG